MTTQDGSKPRKRGRPPKAKSLVELFPEPMLSAEERARVVVAVDSAVVKWRKTHPRARRLPDLERARENDFYLKMYHALGHWRALNSTFKLAGFVSSKRGPRASAIVVLLADIAEALTSVIGGRDAYGHDTLTADVMRAALKALGTSHDEDLDRQARHAKKLSRSPRQT